MEIEQRRPDAIASCDDEDRLSRRRKHHLTFRFDVTGSNQQQIDTIVEETIASAIRDGATLSEYGMEGSRTFPLPEGFGRPPRRRDPRSSGDV